MGKLCDWVRRILRKKGRRKTKVQKYHQIWFAVRLISHCIVLSSKSHLIKLENACKSTMNAESFRKCSQWPGYGQSLAVSWNHSVPFFLCHWGLICPINFLGCSHPYLYFLCHVCDIFGRLFQCFHLMQFSVLCSCFPVQVQRTFCAAEARITTRAYEDNCFYKENFSSFPSSQNIRSASIRTHDSSVEKSCWVWPDKAKEICLSKSEVRVILGLWVYDPHK